MDQVTRSYATPHFVRSVEIRYGGKLVMNADVDFSISENPNFRFYFVPNGEGELDAKVVDNEDLEFSARLKIDSARLGPRVSAALSFKAGASVSDGADPSEILDTTAGSLSQSFGSNFCHSRRYIVDVRAAVAHAAGAPLVIETVQLDGPKAGEVLVEIKATGICHHWTNSRVQVAIRRACSRRILGHEGAGIVVDVGPGVTTVKKGDHVIPLYTPECRPVQIVPVAQDQSLHCHSCHAGQRRNA